MEAGGMNAVKDFAGKAAQSDDITVMALPFSGLDPTSGTIE